MKTSWPTTTSAFQLKYRTTWLSRAFSVADLLPGWDSNPVPDTTRDIGTNWAKGLTTAVLSVPSVVIPRERNYIPNPAHPDFVQIRFSNPEPFYFDDRL